MTSALLAGRRQPPAPLGGGLARLAKKSSPSPPPSRPTSSAGPVTSLSLLGIATGTPGAGPDQPVGGVLVHETSVGGRRPSNSLHVPSSSSSFGSNSLQGSAAAALGQAVGKRHSLGGSRRPSHSPSPSPSTSFPASGGPDVGGGGGGLGVVGQHQDAHGTLSSVDVRRADNNRGPLSARGGHGNLPNHMQSREAHAPFSNGHHPPNSGAFTDRSHGARPGSSLRSAGGAIGGTSGPGGGFCADARAASSSKDGADDDGAMGLTNTTSKALSTLEELLQTHKEASQHSSKLAEALQSASQAVDSLKELQKAAVLKMRGGATIYRGLRGDVKTGLLSDQRVDHNVKTELDRLLRALELSQDPGAQNGGSGSLDLSHGQAGGPGGGGQGGKGGGNAGAASGLADRGRDTLALDSGRQASGAGMSGTGVGGDSAAGGIHGGAQSVPGLSSSARLGEGGGGGGGVDSSQSGRHDHDLGDRYSKRDAGADDDAVDALVAELEAAVGGTHPEAGKTDHSRGIEERGRGAVADGGRSGGNARREGAAGSPGSRVPLREAGVSSTNSAQLLADLDGGDVVRSSSSSNASGRGRKHRHSRGHLDTEDLVAKTRSRATSKDTEEAPVGRKRSKNPRGHSKDVDYGRIDPDSVDNAQVDTFLEALFGEYAAVKDNQGNPLMNNPACRRFFKDFALAEEQKVISAADLHYGEEIERQQDMHFRFNLSKGEAKRGLCFKAFMVLLNLAMPKGMARKAARQHFSTYSGNAKAMREDLQGENPLAA